MGKCSPGDGGTTSFICFELSINTHAHTHESRREAQPTQCLGWGEREGQTPSLGVISARSPHKSSKLSPRPIDGGGYHPPPERPFWEEPGTASCLHEENGNNRPDRESPQVHSVSIICPQAEHQDHWPIGPPPRLSVNLCEPSPYNEAHCLSLKSNSRDFPGSPVVKPALPLQGAQVWSLVGELRSRMPGNGAKKKKKSNSNG